MPRDDDQPIEAVIELRDLRALEVLVNELHFGRAAARLGIDSSTLSRRVAAVERELGTALFERTSRRVALTDAGRVLAMRLPASLRSLDAALAAARDPESSGWEI